MQKTVVSLIIQFYNLLVWLYPRTFRNEFGAEMTAVFTKLVTEASNQGCVSLIAVCLREMRGLPQIVLREYLTNFREKTRRVPMNQFNKISNTKDNRQDNPSSWLELLAGITIFLIIGLDLILGEIPHERTIPSWFTYLRTVLFALALTLPAVGYGIGWVKGFPRWSYSYVGIALVTGWYMMNTATPGFLFGRELWGWRAWVPFLVMTIIALLINRSLRPFFKLFANVWQDWTLLTFAMFGFMPLLIDFGFDEMDRLYSLPFMVILTLVMVGAVVAYLRSVQSWHRVLSLLTGVVLIVAVVAVVPTLYWLENGWVNVSQMVMGGIIVVAAMFSPVLVSLLHRSVSVTNSHP